MQNIILDKNTGDKMIPIEWDENKMNFGSPLIDGQHKHLIEIINLLTTTISDKVEKKDIQYILDKLIDYAAYHFNSEEELFDKVNYPDSEEHKQEHKKFINHFNAMKLNLKKCSPLRNDMINMVEDFYNYLSNWLVNHILGSDKKYIKLLEENKKTIKLKDLKVLYVEDNDELRSYFTKILRMKVKNVDVFEDGALALRFFKEKKAEIDLVITDVEMPNMSGITLLKEIRDIDDEVPYIILSAYIKPEYLLDAITHGVTSYFQKPVNVEELFSKIDYFFYKKVNHMKLLHQKTQIENYLEALDEVALVSKLDIEGNLIYANDICCEVFKYKREEIINKHYKDILHEDTSEYLLNEVLNIVRVGNKWQGRIKLKAKDGTPSHVTMTIFPLYENEDNDLSGYILINFLITDIVEEKREFKKNIISNIADYKKAEFNFMKKISFFEKKLEESKKEIDFYQKENVKMHVKKKKLLKQVTFYEKNIEEKDIQYKKNLEVFRMNFNKINNSYKKLSQETEKNRFEIFQLKEEHSVKEKEIIKLNEEVNEQAKIIIGLRDTIKNI